MNKPIIGIMMRCFKIDEKPIQYIFESVRKCIIKCGGEPLLICPPKTIDYYNTNWNEFPEFSNEELESINYWLDMCDGLFLPGGNKFTKFDLVLFLSGLCISIILLLLLDLNNWVSALIALAPGVIAGFLVMPVPNYHNIRTVIESVFRFITEPKKFIWKGWCFPHEEDKK